MIRRDGGQAQVRVDEICDVGYILIFAVLGNGFAFGLAIAVATMTAHHFANWGRAAAIFGAVALLGGCFHGVRTWNHLFYKEVSFPPL
jgi:hypothetical protein